MPHQVGGRRLGFVGLGTAGGQDQTAGGGAILEPAQLPAAGRARGEGLDDGVAIQVASSVEPYALERACDVLAAPIPTGVRLVAVYIHNPERLLLQSRLLLQTKGTSLQLGQQLGLLLDKKLNLVLPV